MHARYIYSLIVPYLTFNFTLNLILNAQERSGTERGLVSKIKKIKTESKSLHIYLLFFKILREGDSPYIYFMIVYAHGRNQKRKLRQNIKGMKQKTKVHCHATTLLRKERFAVFILYF
jgi:hypothetical protein